MMTSKYLKTALLCACLSTSLICAAPSYADAANEAPTVSVSGYAEEKVAPDTAYITVGMNTTAATAKEARMQNDTIMNRVQHSALSLGIAQKDMKTKNFTVYPTYDKNQKINSYSVSNDLELKVTDFTLISKLIAKAMQDGANDISGVRFTTEKVDTVRSNLIKTAIYNGKQTAQAAAEATGHRLGDVKSITINGNSPSYKATVDTFSLRAAKMETSTPIEPGTNTLSESVEVVYYLQ